MTPSLPIDEFDPSTFVARSSVVHADGHNHMGMGEEPQGATISPSSASHPADAGKLQEDEKVDDAHDKTDHTEPEHREGAARGRFRMFTSRFSSEQGFRLNHSEIRSLPEGTHVSDGARAPRYPTLAHPAALVLVVACAA